MWQIASGNFADSDQPPAGGNAGVPNFQLGNVPLGGCQGCGSFEQVPWSGSAARVASRPPFIQELSFGRIESR